MPQNAGSIVPLSGELAVDIITNGYRWANTNTTTIKWSISNGINGEYWTNPQALFDTINLVLMTVSSYANIVFEFAGSFRTPSAALNAGADINVSLDGSNAIFSSRETLARAFFPDPTDPNRGDLYLNINSAANNYSYLPGTQGYFLVLHELGHALGLKHPHDDGGAGRPTFAQWGLSAFDTDLFTVMSYQDDYSWNKFGWEPQTFMPLDIIGLQYLYGPNLANNAGDTTLSLHDDRAYTTIYDASGSDVVIAADPNLGWYIELPKQALTTRLATPLVGSATPLNQTGLPAPLTMIWLMGDIEKAIGSNAKDKIIGNHLNNIILGLGGPDHIEGGGGNDNITGGDGDDLIMGDEGDDIFDILHDASAGKDTFIGGNGNDSYYLWSLDDTILEDANAGWDTIFTAVSADLRDFPNIEVLIATDSLSDITLTGSDSINFFVGNSGNNRILGLAGDDHIEALGGNDVIHGGQGIDTAYYSTSSANATLTWSEGAWQVKGGATVGTDTLAEVEVLVFSNRSVPIFTTTHASYTSISDDLWFFFLAAFNGAPGVSYMDWMLDRTGNGKSIKSFVDVFVTAPQFKDVYPESMSAQQFATKLVANTLKGTAAAVYEQAAVDKILNLMSSGATRSDVIYNAIGDMKWVSASSPIWGRTAQLFENQKVVAKFYTDVMSQSTTDADTLRSVVAHVRHDTDLSSDAKIIDLIGVSLLGNFDLMA